MWAALALRWWLHWLRLPFLPNIEPHFFSVGSYTITKFLLIFTFCQEIKVLFCRQNSVSDTKLAGLYFLFVYTYYYWIYVKYGYLQFKYLWFQMSCRQIEMKNTIILVIMVMVPIVMAKTSVVMKKFKKQYTRQNIIGTIGVELRARSKIICSDRYNDF